MVAARLLSMSEAAKRTGHISEATLRRYAAEGHLPVKRIGRKLVISEKRLDEWVNTIGDARSKTYPGCARQSLLPEEEPESVEQAS